jgi:hypothetical protein
MGEQSAIFFSTTQIAKKLDRDAKDVFALLSDRGWIKREGKLWRLSAKGQFEGGRYTQHERFGEYIVWPESIKEHRLFSSETFTFLTASQMGKPHKISAKRMNLILSELGWVERFHHGWKLTALGQSVGGQQIEHESTGVPYAQWPERVRYNLQFKATLEQLSQHNEYLSKEADFFISNDRLCGCLDGHQVESAALAEIDNWLYIAGISHAYRREIPTELDQGTERIKESICCDFYLPAGHVYIEYWGQEKSPVDLQRKLARKEIYHAAKLKLIELDESDLDQLDDVMPKLLLQHDVDIY